jgi:hypothetical protein
MWKYVEIHEHDNSWNTDGAFFASRTWPECIFSTPPGSGTAGNACGQRRRNASFERNRNSSRSAGMATWATWYSLV